MAGGNIGTVFVELDLDPKRYVGKMQSIYKSAVSTSMNIETNFHRLGIKSANEFDLMRQRASNAFEMIAHSSKTAKDDMLRAEKAYQTELKRISEEQFGHQRSLIEKLKSHWMAATAAIYVAMRAARTVKGWMEEADAIGKTADAIGLHTKALQEYTYVAKLSGVETSMFHKAVEQLTKKMGELRRGTGELEYKLKDLNPELLTQLQNTRDTEQAMDALFRAMSKTVNPMEKAALAAAAFGKSGVKMVNMVREGYAEMQRLREEANRLGIVLDEKLIKKAERVNDEFSKMEQVIKVNLTAAILEFSPELTAFSELFATLAQKIANTWREFKKFDELRDPFFHISTGIKKAREEARKAREEARKAEEAARKTKEEQKIVMPDMAIGGTRPKIKGLSDFEPSLGYGLTQLYLDVDIDEAIKKGEAAITFLGNYRQQQEESLSKSMAESFADSMINGTNDFLDYFKKSFMKMTMQKTLVEPLEKQLKKLFGPTGFMGKTAFGDTTYGQLATAGMMGISAIEKYNEGGMDVKSGMQAGAGIGAAFGGVGMAVGAVVGGFVGGMLESDTEGKFGQFRDAIYDAASYSFSDGIADGIIRALQQNALDPLIQSFNEGISNALVDVFKRTMMSQAIGPIFERLFADVYDTVAHIEYGPTIGYQMELNAWKLAVFQAKLAGKPLPPKPVGAHEATISDVAEAFPGESEIETALEDLEKTFEAFMPAWDMLSDAIGLNTDALAQNTTALIGPVESFLRELEVGALAPGVSMQGMSAMYNKLLAQAIANPQAFSDFAGFAQSDYLPFMKGYGGDYGALVESVKSDVGGIPWYQQAANTNVDVKVYIDGQELASSVQQSIENDPGVQQSIVTVVRTGRGELPI